jgi:hypothetical protein
MPFILGTVSFNQAIGAPAKVTVAGVAGRLDLMPFTPQTSFTVTALEVDCSTLVASSNVRILVYSNSSTGIGPATKLLESANLSSATTGIKTYTVGYSFTAGTTYWVGVHWDSTSTLRAIPLANLIQCGTPAASGTTINSMYRLSVTFGSAPASYSGGTLTSSIGPEVRFLTASLA